MAIPAYMARSQAGLRLIAQAKMYNDGDFERLRSYIQENYAPKALAEQSVDERLASLRKAYELIGRVQIRELINADKHRAVVILQTELGGVYYSRMKVAEDYPHLITQFIFRPHGRQGEK